MLNKELDSLQDIITILNNYIGYDTYIEISPAFYIYIRQQAQKIVSFNIDVYPETLFGCQIFVNTELKGYEYRITRKEKEYAE